MYVAFVTVGYAISSSCLSVVNKWALMEFPYPATLTALQYLSCCAVVWLCSASGKIECDEMDIKKAWQFMPAVVLFYISVFTNSKLLQYSTVDTFIAFRSCLPLLVSLTEAATCRSENATRPSLPTLGSLIVIALGAVMYVYYDSRLELRSYAWGLAYIVAMTLDIVIIKQIVSSVNLSNWGLVYYNNLLALCMYPIVLLFSSEIGRNMHETAFTALMSEAALSPVLVSCVGGLAISFFGMSARRELSATTFTVVGVINKIGTIIINVLIWEHHSTPLGIISLLLCIAGGVLYQQSLVVETPSSSPSHKPIDTV